MTDEMKPVKCGCGGEAEVDWVLEPSNCYMANVFCNQCGTKTIPFWSTEKDKAIDYAVTTWNRAMGGDQFREVTKKIERTAKVIKEGSDMFCSDCAGFIADTYMAYCPHCGARLEWE